MKLGGSIKTQAVNELLTMLAYAKALIGFSIPPPILAAGPNAGILLRAPLT